MRVALMSGAYVNSGDFLIEKRSKALIERFIPNAEVDILKRNISYDDKIDVLNSYDLIVFGGGPGFQKKMYPNAMPFVKNLEAVKSPVVVLGWGWKAKDATSEQVYKKKVFAPEMLSWLSYMQKDKNMLSCRDWYTVNMLENQGIKKVRMVGCPAWYNLDKIEGLSFRERNLFEKEEPYIIVSDAAFPRNVVCMEKVLQEVRNMFPHARVKVLLHRGVTKQNNFLNDATKMQKYDYTVEDISGSAEGFKQYEECDLHIGFRVHAHIYNLSMGNASILINEDARGNGVNDALGIRNINLNRYLEKEIRVYFNYLKKTNMIQYVQSCERLQTYYGCMKQFFDEICMCVEANLER